MGIGGLWPLLKYVLVHTHLEQFRGARMAVDVSCLLHRGSYTCPRQVADGGNTSSCVRFLTERLERWKNCYDIRVVVVFDGAPLPAKGAVDTERRTARAHALEEARRLAAEGQRSEADKWYEKAIRISDDLTRRCVDELRRLGVEFIIAPYEADAQMAYLAREGLVDAVLTEDSDLLAYGCPLVLSKLDDRGETIKNTDRVKVLALEDLAKKANPVGLDFKCFSPEMFLEMCVLAGCDYSPRVRDMGPKIAHGAMTRAGNWVKACKNMRDGTVPGVKPWNVRAGYEAEVQRAIWTFQHQRVYCPRRQAMAHVTDIPEGGMVVHPDLNPAEHLMPDPHDTSFLGPELSVPEARRWLQLSLQEDMRQTTTWTLPDPLPRCYDVSQFTTSTAQGGGRADPGERGGVGPPLAAGTSAAPAPCTLAQGAGGSAAHAARSRYRPLQFVVRPGPQPAPQLQRQASSNAAGPSDAGEAPGAGGGCHEPPRKRPKAARPDARGLGMAPGIGADRTAPSVTSWSASADPARTSPAPAADRGARDATAAGGDAREAQAEAAGSPPTASVSRNLKGRSLIALLRRP